ncbi:hypothetical protein DdX_11409 [Ditylenchus destructor]|uniref:Uncharacterized protein n=1 Tax=Ditylenchus destructor TaxID=166010 RepID=A0AAD4N0B2_9BILA|nr:hypothetical protein DdX_11409 [Ditylenchus destructor]
MLILKNDGKPSASQKSAGVQQDESQIADSSYGQSSTGTGGSGGAGANSGYAGSGGSESTSDKGDGTEGESPESGGSANKQLYQARRGGGPSGGRNERPYRQAGDREVEEQPITPSRSIELTQDGDEPANSTQSNEHSSTKMTDVMAGDMAKTSSESTVSSRPKLVLSREDRETESAENKTTSASGETITHRGFEFGEDS